MHRYTCIQPRCGRSATRARLSIGCESHAETPRTRTHGRNPPDHRHRRFGRTSPSNICRQVDHKPRGYADLRAKSKRVPSEDKTAVTDENTTSGDEETFLHTSTGHPRRVMSPTASGTPPRRAPGEERVTGRLCVTAKCRLARALIVNMQRIIGLIDYIRFMLKVDFGTTSVPRPLGHPGVVCAARPARASGCQSRAP